jgi:hypothetical protein
LQSLKQGFMALLVADAAGAYWFTSLQHPGPDSQAIWFAPSSAMDPKPFVIPKQRAFALALNSTTLFWLGVDDSSDGPLKLQSVPRGGGEIAQFDVLASWGGLAADDENIYWSGSGIWSTPIAGGSSVKMADGFPCERSLVATAHHVMWLECPTMEPGPEHYLASIPKAGGKPSKLVDPFFAALVPHNDRVYFGLDGAVQVLSEDGGKPRRILDKSIGWFAVDDYALYWVESDAIWKMGLPD